MWGWIHVARNRSQWNALVNTVMNFECHERWEISLLAERLLDSQEELFCVELVLLLFCVVL
jgi:hypothetical protein